MRSSEFIRNISENASSGACGAGSIASIPSVSGKNKSLVGSLFGGTYQQHTTPKKKKSKK